MSGEANPAVAKYATPQTNATLLAILEECGELCQNSAPEKLVMLCRKLERENAELKAEKINAMNRIHELAGQMCLDSGGVAS
jgi:hypothetical protein